MSADNLTIGQQIQEVSEWIDRQAEVLRLIAMRISRNSATRKDLKITAASFYGKAAAVRGLAQILKQGPSIGSS